MGTYSYFSFTETASQAFDLSELLNDPEHQEGVVNGVHFILKLHPPTQAFDNQPSNLNSITSRYGVAWSGKFGIHAMAGDHAKHTLTLDQMIDDLGMSEDWARNPETFGTVITREQVAAEAGADLPPPADDTPTPSALIAEASTDISHKPPARKVPRQCPS